MTFLLAGGLHSRMDVYSGGLELRPWEESDDRAVFDHFRGTWIPASRLVYSGSPTDFVIGSVVLVPVLAFAEGITAALAVCVFALSVLYALSRQRIAAAVPRQFGTLSEFLKHHLARGVGRLADILRRGRRPDRSE